jgi:hypothetical protein
MPYIPVQRIVTVEFLRDPRRKKEYEVRVTPEQVVLRHGDTIVWDVQGLPAGLADRVSFGKFYLLEPSPRVVSGKKGLLPFKPKNLGSQVAKRTAPMTKHRTALEMKPADLGYYKYDIMFDGHTIVDPDAEVRGPRS